MAFVIINGDGNKGIAYIQGSSTRETSGSITILGSTIQTKPGYSGQVRIRATLGAHCVDSAGFSVCAHPNGVVNGVPPGKNPFLSATAQGEVFKFVEDTTAFVGGADSGSDCNSCSGTNQSNVYRGTPA